MKQTFRTGFARTDDGFELYWRSMGEGPPMVCCNGVGVSTFFWKYVAMHFRDRHQVILWDYRGHGLSSVPEDPFQADQSIPRLARDLVDVLDDVGVSEPAILLGHSMGCQVILEFHRQFPDRTRALIPMFGTYGRALDTFLGFSQSRQVFQVVRRLAPLLDRRAFRLMLPLYASPLAFAFSRWSGLIDRYRAGRVDMQHYMDHLQQIDPRVFLRTVELMAEHDLTEHLPSVDVPVLVFGGKNDLFTPIDRSEQMAAAIPDAELHIIEEGSHAAIVEHPADINDRIDRFLSERCPAVL